MTTTFDKKKTVKYWLSGAEYDRTSAHAPWSHSLPVLAEKAALKLPQKTLEMLGEFMEFHVQGRYPDLEMDFYKKCSRSFASSNLSRIRKVYQWLRSQL